MFIGSFGITGTATLKQIAAGLKKDKCEVSPRITELVATGFLIPTDARHEGCRVLRVHKVLGRARIFREPQAHCKSRPRSREANSEHSQQPTRQPDHHPTVGDHSIAHQSAKDVRRDNPERAGGKHQGLGLKVPLQIRKQGEKYEIIAGERRWRAAGIAKLKEVPAIVCEMSDDKVLELQMLENLQREDLHPMDEASGYEQLLERGKGWRKLGEQPATDAEKFTVEGLAAKIGKSASYVYQRLKLASLIPDGQQLFRDNVISAGHAILIARLTPTDQLRALRACFDRNGFHKKEPLKELIKLNDGEMSMSEKGLREWIQDEINLDLRKVPWDLTDEKLTAAGSCDACPKRSKNNAPLFSEFTAKGEDRCFDGDCYKAKRDAFVKITVKAKEGAPAPLKLSDMAGYTKPKPDQEMYRRGQWEMAKKGSCPSVQTGVVVRGENAGNTHTVCIDPNCKVHKKHFSGSNSGGGHSQTDYQLEEFKRHKQEVVRRKRATLRANLAKVIIQEAKATLPPEVLRIAADDLLSNANAKEMGWLLGDVSIKDDKSGEAIVAKATGAKLNQLILTGLLHDVLDIYGDERQKESRVAEVAQHFGIKPQSVMAADERRMKGEKTCRACGCTESTACEFWEGGTRKRCSWKEPGLCSHPLCSKYDPKPKPAVEAQTSAKPEKKAVAKAKPAKKAKAKAAKGGR
jgi:ParB family chromosome partitioning protein